jgi:hypothetical protein
MYAGDREDHRTSNEGFSSIMKPRVRDGLSGGTSNLLGQIVRLKTSSEALRREAASGCCSIAVGSDSFIACLDECDFHDVSTLDMQASTSDEVLGKS